MKVIINNQSVDFDGAVVLMDDDIRERLVNTIWWDQSDATSCQNFVNAYCVAHAEKYGTDFMVN